MEIQKIPSELVLSINNNLTILQNPAVNNYKKLEYVYNEAEKVNDFLRPYFSCHPGCSFCCKYDVLISAFEANYISLKTQKRIKNEKLTIMNNSLCPFLQNDICSIYKYRPLICRTYHVRGNPENCKIDYNLSLKHIEQYGTKNGNYGNQIYKEFARFIDTVNTAVFYNEFKDIRNFF